MELWKRYSASIAHRWGLTGFNLRAEHPRPQYLARLKNAKKYRVNVITGIKEPCAPFWTVRVPATCFSFSVVLSLVCFFLLIKAYKMFKKFVEWY